MRITGLLFLLIIAALIAGFLPRPLITPDWRTPFENALAAQDCEGIRRALEIQMITNNQPAWFEIVDTVEQKEICGFKRNVDKDYDFNSKEMHKPWTFLQRAGVSSFLGPRIEGFLNNQPYSKNPIIRASQRRSKDNLYSCLAHFPPISSYPDYTLMAYALERTEISLDEISQISFQQRAACAGKMLDEALLMLSAAKTAKEYEVALGHAGYFYILNFSAPDVGGELRKLTEALPQEVKSESSWETGMILRLENYLEHTIGCVYPSELTLAGAAQCANRAASQISENPEAALFAHYYALRAKRLGWTDIAVAEAAASNNLTEECLSAVAALEEEHTNGASDYRTYNFLRSPFDLTYQPACSYLRLPESD